MWRSSVWGCNTGGLVHGGEERSQVRRKQRAKVAALSSRQVAKAANDVPAILRAAGAIERRRDFPLGSVVVEGNLLPRPNWRTRNEFPSVKVYGAVRYAGMVHKCPQSAAGLQVFALPPLDSVFAGLGYHLAGQVKNPLVRTDILDATDRGPEWSNDPRNLLGEQH